MFRELGGRNMRVQGSQKCPGLKVLLRRTSTTPSDGTPRRQSDVARRNSQHTTQYLRSTRFVVYCHCTYLILGCGIKRGEGTVQTKIRSTRRNSRVHTAVRGHSGGRNTRVQGSFSDPENVLVRGLVLKYTLLLTEGTTLGWGGDCLWAKSLFEGELFFEKVSCLLRNEVLI